jgi:hypothetical protein
MIDVATIQTATHAFTRRAIVAPRTDDGTVLLDCCPHGTMDVHTFATARKAAEFARVSVSTIYRQLRADSDTMTFSQTEQFNQSATAALNAHYNAPDFKASGDLDFVSATLGWRVQLIDRENYSYYVREIHEQNSNVPPNRTAGRFWMEERKIKVGRSWYAVIEQN